MVDVNQSTSLAGCLFCLPANVYFHQRVPEIFESLVVLFILSPFARLRQRNLLAFYSVARLGI